MNSMVSLLFDLPKFSKFQEQRDTWASILKAVITMMVRVNSFLIAKYTPFSLTSFPYFYRVITCQLFYCLITARKYYLHFRQLI